MPHADANLTRLPDHMEPALTAALGCRVTTARQALTGRAAAQPGEWVAIFGGGGVGLPAMLLARAIGARTLVVEVVEAKLAHARALGADATVNAAAADAPAAVRDLTGGGAHVALEALGIGTTTAGALRSLRKLGRMVQIGMPAWRYPNLLSLIAAGRAGLSSLVTRRIALSDASAELAASDGPTPPGVAVIPDVTR